MDITAKATIEIIVGLSFNLYQVVYRTIIESVACYDK
jgi:hypothetical protein